MNKTSRNRESKIRVYLLLILFFFISLNAFSQNATTTFSGVVKDSLTNEILPFVTIQFKGTTIGAFSDDDGVFKLSNRQNNTTVVVSFMGYQTKTIIIPVGRSTRQDILLVSQDKVLNEVIVRPKKEKYSKKNNPAVDLIRKVIANKHKNNVDANESYRCDEYEQLLLALNDFKPSQSQFKKFKFLPNYVVTSSIENKPILPFSVRETISEKYYRKDPKSEKRVMKAYDQSGLDKAMEIDGLDVVLNEVFKDVSIFDNSMTLLFHEFVSPLSELNAVGFFRWYIADTVSIEDKRYVRLDFVPFNTRDLGFTGSLYVTTDSTYAIRKAVLRAPQKMNINFVDELIIQHDFKEIAPGKWVPDKQQMAIDMSMVNAIKFYVDKNRVFNNYVFNEPLDSIHLNRSPVVYEKGFDKKTDEYWAENRPQNYALDYRMDDMMEDIMSIGFFKVLVETGKFISGGAYLHTNKDPAKNKVDIGTATTFYSFNRIEGNRIRLTSATTKNFNPHLYLYGYGAYGTKDGRFKYYGEATWTFNKVDKHKDEFPKNNITVAYKYDMNSLGQRFVQSERDNIFMSIQSSKNKKLTYNRQSHISWTKEYHNGFSFKLTAQTSDERPAGGLKFEKLNDLNMRIKENSIRTSEAMIALRYAPNEKFFQHHRQRYNVPSPGLEIDFSHVSAIKGAFGGQFDYSRSSLTLSRRFWIPRFGKLTVDIQTDRVWGEAPFPFLITPSANSSYTIQSGNFYLIEPLEFIHDKQISWDIEYKLEGWLFNRIPLIRQLKIREIVGFRGVVGDLSDRNDPVLNHNMLLFPDNAYKANKEPYMEYTVGVENIFSLLRVDYVRRINYKNHPNVNKDGIRLSLQFIF